MLHGVLKHFHPMIGRDLHTLWPPGSPSPGSPAPHCAMSSLMGTGLTAQMGPTELTHFGWTIMRGSDIGPMIPHAGPPNCLLPVILLASGSKSHFGSSQTLVRDKPVAAALLGVVNPNLNCGDPAPTPLDGVVALTAHFVGMTWGDILAGLANMAFDAALQYVLNKLGDRLFNRVTQRVYERFLFGPMLGMFERMGEGRVATWLLQHEFQEMMAKGFFAQVTKLVGSWTVGSPVGYSFPFSGLSELDGLGDRGDGRGFMERSHDAIRSYIDTPAVETHDAPDASQSTAPASAGEQGGVCLPDEDDGTDPAPQSGSP